MPRLPELMDRLPEIVVGDAAVANVHFRALTAVPASIVASPPTAVVTPPSAKSISSLVVVAISEPPMLVAVEFSSPTLTKELLAVIERLPEITAGLPSPT